MQQMNDPLISICHNSWAFDYRAMEGSNESEIINQNPLPNVQVTTIPCGLRQNIHHIQEENYTF